MQYPLEIKQEDYRGRTCFHAACSKKPPMRVLRAMLISASKLPISSSSFVELKRPSQYNDVVPTTEMSTIHDATDPTTAVTVATTLLTRRNNHGCTPCAILLDSSGGGGNSDSVGRCFSDRDDLISIDEMIQKFNDGYERVCCYDFG